MFMHTYACFEVYLKLCIMLLSGVTNFPLFALKNSNASLKLKRKPRENDFETIKLISNGAYG